MYAIRSLDESPYETARGMMLNGGRGMIVFCFMVAAVAAVVSWFSPERGLAGIAFACALALCKCGDELQRIRKQHEELKP